MTELDREINTIIMQEIGLEIGRNNKIYDQDTGDAIRMNDMDLVAPGFYGGRHAIEFDPHNNKKMMGQLFGYFLNKYADESGVEIPSYHNIDDKSKDSGFIECLIDEDGTLNPIRSKAYKRDSLKYTDIIMQLNGDNSVDLSKYDQDVVKPTVKKKSK